MKFVIIANLPTTVSVNSQLRTVFSYVITLFTLWV